MLTLRSTILLLFVAPLLVGATWFPVLEALAWGYGLAMLLLLGADFWFAQGQTRFQVKREHDTKLSLGADNPITLTVVNRHAQPVTIRLRDDPPQAFEIDTHSLDGTVEGRGQWQGIYYLKPFAPWGLSIWGHLLALVGAVGAYCSARALFGRDPGEGLP